MTSLSRFEAFVESILEGSFARLMRSRLQPVEIAKRLTRAMEAEQTIFAGKIVAPNEYRVNLNPEDFAVFEPARASWEQELAQYLVGVAKERGVAIFGSPVVSLEAEPGVPAREVRVAAHVVDRERNVSHVTDRDREMPRAMDLAQTQRIDAALIRQAADAAQEATLILRFRGSDLEFPMRKRALAIGRDLDNDVVIETPGVSRYHAEIRLHERSYVLRDLKSTNGTTVNGLVVSEQVLFDGDRLSFAGTDAVFRIAR